MNEPTTGALYGAADHFRVYANGHGHVAYQAIMALLRKREQDRPHPRDELVRAMMDFRIGPPSAERCSVLIDWLEAHLESRASRPEVIRDALARASERMARAGE